MKKILNTIANWVLVILTSFGVYETVMVLYGGNPNDAMALGGLYMLLFVPIAIALAVKAVIFALGLRINF